AGKMERLTTNYAGLTNISTDEKGRNKKKNIKKTVADYKERALIMIKEMNVSTEQHYVGIDNTQTTDSNGRDRNVMIQEGIDTINQKIVGCYDADHPKTCNITSGAKYVQYAP